MILHPIDLSAPEILALAAGRKRQHRVPLLDGTSQARDFFDAKTSRRALFDQATVIDREGGLVHCGLAVPYLHQDGHVETRDSVVLWPRWMVGDCLWGREAWSARSSGEGPRNLEYAARLDGQRQSCRRWQSRRTMPRTASRITLGIARVTLERLQSITHESILAEGIEAFSQELGRFASHPLVHHRAHLRGLTTLREAFAAQWCALRHRGRCGANCSWLRNDWVWVLHLRDVKVCESPEALAP